ncbi:hypothetical protein AYL99_06225 [Fonsecaea erecta]|uniref:Uncharacterized protein n=1 Tax=Fonsecaea erecta TaxID=1367422 RepID=A0A178ZGM2_9EURO|nr:hypothetical protein AYL99_06225 [Fonsecaea erecta]OAP58928.1 hypothetical protein AYL99_06225 [Fonsecaea erecta]
MPLMTPLQVQRQEKAVRDWIATLKEGDKVNAQKRFDSIRKLPREQYLHKLRSFLNATTEDIAPASDVDRALVVLQAPQNFSAHVVQAAAKTVIDHEKARNNMGAVRWAEEFVGDGRVITLIQGANICALSRNSLWVPIILIQAVVADSNGEQKK